MKKNSPNSLNGDVDVDLAAPSTPRVTSLFGNANARLTVDMQAQGTHHGHLELPALDHTRSPRQLRIPVCVINGLNPGPTITLIAGVHGDEPEGSLVLHRLARELNENTVHGRLILLPVANPVDLTYATRSRQPHARNLDHVFPGHDSGNISERLAHEITQRFVKPAELVVDLRSGGNAVLFIPSAAIRFDSDKTRQRRCEDAMIAFGAPNSLRLPASAPYSCLQATVHAMGKDYVQTELGGAATYSIKTVSLAHTGCLNILRHKGMLKDDIELASTRLLEVQDDSCYLYASNSGIVDWYTHPGEITWKDVPMAKLYPPNDTSSPGQPVISRQDAVLLASHPGGYVNEGDLLAILAQEVQG